VAGKPTHESARAVFEQLADEWLAAPNVTMGRSLSNEVLKVDNKIFAFVNDGRLVVKLPSARCKSMVAEGAATPFTSGGRTMKEWVAVPLPPAGAQAWRALMTDANAFVGRG
jgi:hypothetical protein